jgi:hypothetical protein
MFATTDTTIYRIVIVLVKMNLSSDRVYLIKRGGKSGVSGRTRLLLGTLAHALVVLHNTLPAGHGM